MVMKRKQPPSPINGDDPPGDTPSYSVGYCRPPLHSRFKAGKSGNPKGRPRGRKNLRTILDNVLKERVTLREGDQSRVVSKAEALVLKQVNGALTNDHKAAAAVLLMLRVMGHFDEELTAESNLLPPDQQDALVRDYYERTLLSEQPRPGRAKRGRRK